MLVNRGVRQELPRFVPADNEGRGSIPKAGIEVARPPQHRWDDLENTPWDSVERQSKVGHDKCLAEHDCCTSPLGTTTTFALIRRHSPKVDKSRSYGIFLNAVVRASSLPFE